MQKTARSEKERRKRAEYELGRYKKKVAQQQKVIDRLEEEITGYQQSIDMSYALVTAAVLQAGTLTINREELSRILQEKVYAVGSYDEESMDYTLRVQEVSGDGDEEEEPSEQG